MKVQLTSPNGSARRLAVQAFAEEARRACAPGNLVPLPDQGSVRMLGDTSQQMIADPAILHPYESQPPGTGQVIADCDLVLRGMERFAGEDVQAMRQSVSAYCSKMNKLSLASVAGGLALGAGLYFAGMGWVSAAGVLPAVAGILYAEKQKGEAREFEAGLQGWDRAIQTGNPHRLPIPEHGAVSFEYVFMVEKAHIGVSRAYRMPTALLSVPTSWTGVDPQPSKDRTLIPPENVASLDLKPKVRTRFDGPDPVWPTTDVLVPEPLAQTAKMAEQLDPSERSGPAVQEAGERVMVGGIAVRKKKKPISAAPPEGR